MLNTCLDALNTINTYFKKELDLYFLPGLNICCS